MESLDRVVGGDAHLHGVEPAVDIQLLKSKAERPAIDPAASQDGPLDLIWRQECRGVRLQERGPVDHLAVFGIDRKIIAGMFDGEGFVDFFLQFGQRGVLFLGREERSYVVDLLFQAIIDQVIQSYAAR